jgi:hypothetical protein
MIETAPWGTSSDELTVDTARIPVLRSFRRLHGRPASITASSSWTGNSTKPPRCRSSSKRLVDFILDPVAGDRGFRQHQQYLVAEADGLVVPGPRAVR